MLDNAARKLSLAFAAGGVGAIANSLSVWGSGQLGITQLLGVTIVPTFTPAWLYPRIVWGGLWGFLLALPVLQTSWALRGLVFSLAPTAYVFLVIFPSRPEAGVLGTNFGTLTPVIVLVANAVWGLAASAWYRSTAK
jgi:hypothetical protein